jgi:nucleotide-binding universal stress UspA family protein
VPYKTILVHCNDKRRVETLLAPTVQLAQTFQAHLLGLSVVPPVSVVAAGVPGVPPMVLDAQCQLYPAADICTALARHGVKCEATDQVRPHECVGSTLIACAKDSDAGLLVMGCYGHTRFRELVFGGASRLCSPYADPGADVALSSPGPA